MKNLSSEFKIQVKKNIAGLRGDLRLKNLSNSWVKMITKHKYCYNFRWLDRPIIQFPQDVLALQEIIWKAKPEIIIETGIAHGGSLVFYASLLELIGKRGKVIGIDVDIRKHNLAEIKKNKFFDRIILMEGSSTDENIFSRISKIARKKKTMVCLDSLHTHEHVFNELTLYSQLIQKGGYLVVFDTIIEDMPKHLFPQRPWDKNNNPKTAVRKFLKVNKRFKIDYEIESKLLITSAPEGYLKCIKD